MPNPKRDNKGLVVPYNDPTISGDDLLIRVVPEYHLHPNSQDQRRVSKSAFSPSSRNVDPYQGMSVDLLSLLTQLGIDPADSDQYNGEVEVIVAWKVEQLRKSIDDLQIGLDPKTDNPAHCAIWNVNSTSKKKKLLAIAKWIRRPNDVIF